MTPDQVDKCSPWQLVVCIAGWSAAQGNEPKAPDLSDEEFDDLMEKYG